MLACFDPAKLADVQDVIDNLEMLPREALIYIAGYIEGTKDQHHKVAPDQRPAG